MADPPLARSSGRFGSNCLLISRHLVQISFAFSVCLLRFYLATVQATLLLFARLERSRTPTLHAWSFHHWTLGSDCMAYFVDISERCTFTFRISLPFSCTIPAPHGGSSDFWRILILFFWLVGLMADIGFFCKSKAIGCVGIWSSVEANYEDMMMDDDDHAALVRIAYRNEYRQDITNTASLYCIDLAETNLCFFLSPPNLSLSPCDVMFSLWVCFFLTA